MRRCVTVRHNGAARGLLSPSRSAALRTATAPYSWGEIMRTFVTLAAVAAILTLRTLGALELPATDPAPAEVEAAVASADAGTVCTCWNGAGAGDALTASAD